MKLHDVNMLTDSIIKSLFQSIENSQQQGKVSDFAVDKKMKLSIEDNKYNLKNNLRNKLSVELEDDSKK